MFIVTGRTRIPWYSIQYTCSGPPVALEQATMIAKKDARENIPVVWSATKATWQGGFSHKPVECILCLLLMVRKQPQGSRGLF